MPTRPDLLLSHPKEEPRQKQALDIIQSEHKVSRVSKFQYEITRIQCSNDDIKRYLEWLKKTHTDLNASSLTIGYLVHPP